MNLRTMRWGDFVVSCVSLVSVLRCLTRALMAHQGKPLEACPLRLELIPDLVYMIYRAFAITTPCKLAQASRRLD